MDFEDLPVVLKGQVYSNFSTNSLISYIKDGKIELPVEELVKRLNNEITLEYNSNLIVLENTKRSFHILHGNINNQNNSRDLEYKNPYISKRNYTVLKFQQDFKNNKIGINNYLNYFIYIYTKLGGWLDDSKKYSQGMFISPLIKFSLLGDKGSFIERYNAITIDISFEKNINKIKRMKRRLSMDMKDILRLIIFLGDFEMFKFYYDYYYEYNVFINKSVNDFYSDDILIYVNNEGKDLILEFLFEKGRPDTLENFIFSNNDKIYEKMLVSKHFFLRKDIDILVGWLVLFLRDMGNNKIKLLIQKYGEYLNR